MIKEALEYIVGLSRPMRYTINGDEYSDKPLRRIAEYIPRADAVGMSTLSSLVDYIKSKVDDMSEKMIIQVVSPSRVILFSNLDSDRQREYIAEVKADIPAFKFDTFMDKEQFIIGMQAKFLDDQQTDKALVLKFAGTVESGTIAEYGDDGVTQKASVKTGIASRTEGVVPNPVTLRPYRTFIEVAQPASDFIFRMKQDKYDGVNCAVFEADGGAWICEAKDNIKRYLEEELADFKEQFIVIS